MISRIMTVAPATLNISDTVREAIKLIDSLEIRHIPIVDDRDQLMGVLSDRDVGRYRPGFDLNPEETVAADLALDTPVSKLMSRGVIYVNTRDQLGTAIDALLEHQIGAVPVVDERTGDIAGMLSYVDILRHLRADLEP